MDSAVSVTTTAQMVLFRSLHRHLSGPPHRHLLRRKLKCAVTSYNNRSPFPCSSTSVPLSPSLCTLHALLSRTSCRTRCISSSAASSASSGGSGNGDSGAGNGGGGGGSGGEFGDASASIKLIGDTAQEFSTLSPDAIILDVSGMVCGGCAASVKRILESQPQVSSVSVNLTTETAIVWPVSEAKTAPNWQKQLGKTLAEHLTSSGFDSRLRDSRLWHGHDKPLLNSDSIASQEAQSQVTSKEFSRKFNGSRGVHGGRFNNFRGSGGRNED